MKVFSKTDKKIYLAMLQLLKEGHRITIPRLANMANVTKGLIYYKMNNLHIYHTKKEK